LFFSPGSHVRLTALALTLIFGVYPASSIQRDRCLSDGRRTALVESLEMDGARVGALLNRIRGSLPDMFSYESLRHGVIVAGRYYQRLVVILMPRAKRWAEDLLSYRNHSARTSSPRAVAMTIAWSYVTIAPLSCTFSGSRALRSLPRRSQPVRLEL
jgi:hypothetical protein